MVSQFIKNRYSNDLVCGNVDILKMIQNPLSKKKEDCPLWNFITIKEGSDKKRKQENYDEILALILDFDNNVTIKEFQDNYSKFNYYLYTTTSHSKEQDKFRVIVPIKSPIKYSFFHSSEVLEALGSFFVHIDISSFSNFHNLPNKPLDPSDYYWFFNDSSEFFEFDILNDDIKKIARKNELERKKNATRGLGKNYSSEMSESARVAYKRVVESNLEKEFYEIPSSRSGDRFFILRSFIGKMMKAKYPDNEYIFDKYEIESLVFQNCADKAVRNVIESFWKGR